MSQTPRLHVLRGGIMVALLVTYCIVTAHAIVPEIVWQHAWGGGDYDVNEDVAVTATHVYVAGVTYSFIEGPLAYVAQYDKGGGLQWDRTWGVNYDYADAVASDGSNVYIAGSTNISYPTQSFNIFLAKFNAAGELLWDATWGGDQTEWVSDLATNGTHVFVVGTTYSFGRDGDAFVAAFEADGTLAWDRVFGRNGAIDSGNAVLVTGSTLYVVGSTIIPGFNYDAFLATVDGQGALNGFWMWGRSGDDEAHALATDGSHLYVAGYTNASTSHRDAFLAQFTPDGTLIWEKTWGGDRLDDAYGVAYARGAVFIAGLTYSFGDGSQADAFVAGFQPDGTPLWDRLWGEGQAAGAYSLTSDDVHLYAAGTTIAFPHPLIEVNAYLPSPDPATVYIPTLQDADPTAFVEDPSVTPGDPTATLDTPVDMEAFILKIGPWIVGGEVIPTHLADLIVPPIIVAATLIVLIPLATRALVTKRRPPTQ